MPGFKANYQHNLGKEVAVEKLKHFSAKVREKYGNQISDMEEQWDDAGNLNFGFKALGLKISGVMSVDDSNAEINGELPFAAVMFRGRIENEITSALESALSSE